jgi:hypothetical protein
VSIAPQRIKIVPVIGLRGNMRLRSEALRHLAGKCDFSYDAPSRECRYPEHKCPASSTAIPRIVSEEKVMLLHGKVAVATGSETRLADRFFRLLDIV